MTIVDRGINYRETETVEQVNQYLSDSTPNEIEYNAVKIFEVENYKEIKPKIELKLKKCPNCEHLFYKRKKIIIENYHHFKGCPSCKIPIVFNGEINPPKRYGCYFYIHENNSWIEINKFPSKIIQNNQE